MKRLAVMTAAAVGLVGAAVAMPAGAAAVPATASAGSAGSVAWAPCPLNDPVLGGLLQGLDCGTLSVPLDYRKPHGRQIKLALSRARHTSADSQYQGVVLLNRGGPGGFGRDLPTRFARGTFGLPTQIGAQYDWIGFDPRGVAGSEPTVACDPSYLYPGKARADFVPANKAEEDAWRARARAYSADCGAKYGSVLAHISTENVSRDMDRIRTALGARQINYFGYSYGTYLGSVYASMFPTRVRRMVLDSVVRPSGAWYEDNLDQNEAFEKRADIFFAWIARHDAVYRLGSTAAAVERNYYRGMARIERNPVDGKIGPSEYNDIFVPDGYRNYTWADHAQVLADYVLRDDPQGLRDNFGEPAWLDQNSYAIYLSVQCRDAPWPRSWSQWHADHSTQYGKGYKFLTWNNAWYNAPCATWPVKGGPPVRVGGEAGGPNIVLVQAENDAATPYGGAVEVHKRFPSSRLILEKGGNNHGASLSGNGNACLNDLVSAYLGSGTRPASRPGPDAVCAAKPAPGPAVVTVGTAGGPTAYDPPLVR
ncbi:alpha/beta hydrolase [Actinomadura sp. HBU206391]|uniref:alpha/beta hydrolase n=1 Tax=Actinomadura sp. HBU206391 TaxID=2731692 RepID=UPI00164F435B|nr:alpha/beta hydrolase [Actinomadura sp. HBU206391]MBC6460028.1 alpha/beta fold hydrolase [Actinomadura sp. HBU206391]